LPPPPHDPGESPAAPERPKVNRTLLIVLGAVLVVAIVVVVVLLLTRSNDDSPATVEGYVAEQLSASDQNVEAACGAIHSFAADRAGLVRLLDTMPVQARNSLVQTLRTQGGSWLPPESADWGYPEFRRGLLAVWDECARRGK
jgi:hypothetical protein